MYRFFVYLIFRYWLFVFIVVYVCVVDVEILFGFVFKLLSFIWLCWLCYVVDGW